MKLRKTETVSYTHLDVYKRQPSYIVLRYCMADVMVTYRMVDEILLLILMELPK